MSAPPPPDPLRLFSDYLRVTGVAHTEPEPTQEPLLAGKRLGLINGSSWITLWSNYFGRLYLPGVHLVNAGNEAIQINFMQAHQAGQPVPPLGNVEAFKRYALDLVELAQVDAVLITCSTMNRAYLDVRRTLAPHGVPVFQIDRPMMEKAVLHGGEVLVIATHGPTVENTHALLCETAEELGKPVSFSGAHVEEAWQRLAAGDVEGHNRLLADAIYRGVTDKAVGCVVLAQLSMTVFLLNYPDPIAEFGVPVLTSGQCGFEYIREYWTNVLGVPH